jgi:hypothetical protein
MSSSILLPANISTNSFISPNNIEGSSLNRLLFITPSSFGAPDSQKKFALLTSLILCNRINSNLNVNAKIINDANSAYLLYNVIVPPGTAFEVINGNKITMKEGDELRVWHNSTSENVLDATLSYTLHNPLTLYDI